MKLLSYILAFLHLLFCAIFKLSLSVSLSVCGVYFFNFRNPTMLLVVVTGPTRGNRLYHEARS